MANASSVLEPVSPELQPLVDELGKLSPEDLRKVVRAVSGARPTTRSRHLDVSMLGLQTKRTGRSGEAVTSNLDTPAAASLPPLRAAGSAGCSREAVQ